MGEYSRAKCAELIRESVGYMRVLELDHYGLKMENAPCLPEEVIERIDAMYVRLIDSFDQEHLAMAGALLRSTFVLRDKIKGNFNRLFDLAMDREIATGSRLLIGLSRVQ